MPLYEYPYGLYPSIRSSWLHPVFKVYITRWRLSKSIWTGSISIYFSLLDLSLLVVFKPVKMSVFFVQSCINGIYAVVLVGNRFAIVVEAWEGRLLGYSHEWRQHAPASKHTKGRCRRSGPMRFTCPDKFRSQGFSFYRICRWMNWWSVKLNIKLLCKPLL